MDGYRPITLATMLSKALEWCLLIQYSNYLSTFELQFGFKPGHSTTLCTGTVKNVISHFLQRGSSVFECFLDASKAFDFVQHSVLFQKLLERGLPTVVVRFLFRWYSQQKLKVCWGNTHSSVFGVSSGVRQGGVLSPILFSIYLDTLLLALKESRIGCTLGGVFAYADGSILIAPPSILFWLKHCYTYIELCAIMGMKSIVYKNKQLRKLHVANTKYKQ